MPDARVEAYAELLVDRILKPEPAHQVLVLSSYLARPLYEQVLRRLARRGAYALSRIGLGGGPSFAPYAWAEEAPAEVLAKPSSIEAEVMARIDGLIALEAPENTREGTRLVSDRLALVQKASRPLMERLLSHECPWVGCQYPCPSLAQEAGMSLGEFEDFLYGAVLIDWEAEEKRMRRYADRFDAADEVRIVGAGTDLTLSLAGRKAVVDALGANVPGGEFFFCPVEDSAEGVIEFSEFPAVYAGREIEGIRLRFEGGRIVDAAAARNEEFLVATLDTDDGARRLGELGIGCNPGITRHMKNTLFDEKMDGTVHLAVGNGFPDMGGTNVSAVHWDIVKDLRSEGRILLDGDVVQENGAWRV